MHIKRLPAVFLCIILSVCCFGTTVNAQSAYGYYSYWTGYNTKKGYETKATYTVKAVIGNDDLGLTAFSQPSDLFFDGEKIYLLDANNNRVVILNADYTAAGQITHFTDHGEEMSINGASGIFVDDDKLYLANPEQGNIIVADSNGTVNKVIVKPESNVIPSDFNFRPSKLVVDSRGFLYVTCEECYYGAFVFDADGNFLSLFGSNKVEGTVLDVLQKVWDLVTNNSAKRANSVQNLPYQFVNIHVDNNDFIYTVTGKANSYGTVPGQIKKLSPAGSNILKYKNGYKSESASALDFGDTTIPVDSATGMKRILNFISLATDENGYIYVVDRTYGKIFVYDKNCNCITVFGSSDGKGEYDGTFKYVADIAVVNGDILILDSETGLITVFEPTEYVKSIMNANLLTQKALYGKSKPAWNEVLKQDKNCQLAYRGLAKAFLDEGDYEKALEYAEIGVDQETYSLAFAEKRSVFLSRNFGWIFAACILLITGLILSFVFCKRKGIKLIKNQKLAVLTSEVFHPFDAFNHIKYKNGGSLVIATAMLLIFAIISVFGQLYGGFMYTVFDADAFNPYVTFAKNIAIVILWVIANWGVCTLSHGKGKVKEIYIVTCYALLPLIVNQLLFLIMSHMLTNESAAIPVCNAICYIFAGWLLCIGIMTVHEYSFPKFTGTALLAVIGMFFIIFILFMIFILGQEFVSFISTIFKEIAYR